jgi:hypothetical protein
MDLSTARDLRLMADEYFEKAARIEAKVLEASNVLERQQRVS